MPPAVEAEHRFAAALAEAHEQLANDWTPTEIAAVLADAATVIDDLRMHAEIAQLQRQVDAVAHHLEVA